MTVAPIISGFTEVVDKSHDFTDKQLFSLADKVGVGPKATAQVISQFLLKNFSLFAVPNVSSSLLKNQFKLSRKKFQEITKTIIGDYRRKAPPFHETDLDDPCTQASLSIDPEVITYPQLSLPT